ncbi:hypothetical protein DdX_12473 [Ditylenchus destructor]|uniref:Uncharacterized protein n=1 Tax=Ditylenchus destructor TaxID=166010 RepID=A0AAD4MUH0_9BILA|nr:hypothetical protein DdX_12473 [Ditylenchus destructor]
MENATKSVHFTLLPGRIPTDKSTIGTAKPSFRKRSSSQPPPSNIPKQRPTLPNASPWIRRNSREAIERGFVKKDREKRNQSLAFELDSAEMCLRRSGVNEAKVATDVPVITERQFEKDLNLIRECDVDYRRAGIPLSGLTGPIPGRSKSMNGTGAVSVVRQYNKALQREISRTSHADLQNDRHHTCGFSVKPSGSLQDRVALAVEEYRRLIKETSHRSSYRSEYVDSEWYEHVEVSRSDTEVKSASSNVSSSPTGSSDSHNSSTLAEVVRRKIFRRVELDWPDLFVLKHSHLRNISPKERALRYAKDNAYHKDICTTLEEEIIRVYSQYQMMLEQCIVVNVVYSRMAWQIMLTEAHWYAGRVISDTLLRNRMYNAALKYGGELLDDTLAHLEADDMSVLKILEKLSTILVECEADGQLTNLSSDRSANLSHKADVKKERKLIKIKNNLMRLSATTQHRRFY